MTRRIAGLVLAVAIAAASAHAAIADTRTATLQWTAPGDDGMVGQATYYDIRFSRSPITQANFLFATRLNTTLLPGIAGTMQQLTVVGLTAGVGYYFALRAMDVSGNWGLVSNIAYLPSDVLGVGAPGGEPQFSAPFPNPARGGTNFGVTLPQPGRLRVEAFDISGRLVRTLALGEYSAGHFDLHWDLSDGAGRVLPSGTYLVRSQIDDTVVLRRVTVVN